MYNNSKLILKRMLCKVANTLPQSAIAPAPNPAQVQASQRQMMEEAPTQTVANPEIQKAQEASMQVSQQAEAKIGELQSHMQQVQQEAQAQMAKLQQDSHAQDTKNMQLIQNKQVEVDTLKIKNEHLKSQLDMAKHEGNTTIRSQKDYSDRLKGIRGKLGKSASDTTPDLKSAVIKDNDGLDTESDFFKATMRAATSKPLGALDLMTDKKKRDELFYPSKGLDRSTTGPDANNLYTPTTYTPSMGYTMDGIYNGFIKPFIYTPGDGMKWNNTGYDNPIGARDELMALREQLAVLNSQVR